MTEQDFILAHQCGQLHCKALVAESVSVCPYCGGHDVKPFYNYYNILKINVAPSNKHVELSNLNSAYRKASLKYHPDINKGGKKMFLLVSEAFKTLKDTNSKQKYDFLYQRIAENNFGVHQDAYGSPQGRQTTYWQDNVNQQEYDFETIFRNFHGFEHRNINLKRASHITSMLGTIIGIFVGFLTGGLLLIPAAIFGYVVGKFNPHLGPLLIKITNFFVMFLSFATAVFFLFVGRIMPIFFILLITFLYLNKSKHWESEFKEL